MDKCDNTDYHIIDLKLQLLLNKRLFSIKAIPRDLYEKVENNILAKLYRVEEKLSIYNNH